MNMVAAEAVDMAVVGMVVVVAVDIVMTEAMGADDISVKSVIPV